MSRPVYSVRVTDDHDDVNAGPPPELPEGSLSPRPHEAAADDPRAVQPLDPSLDLVEVLEQQLDIAPTPEPEPIPVVELLGFDALRQDRRANIVAAAVAGAGVLAVVISGLLLATGPAPTPVAQSGTGAIFSSTSPFVGGGSKVSGGRTGTAGEGTSGTSGTGITGGTGGSGSSGGGSGSSGGTDGSGGTGGGTGDSPTNPGSGSAGSGAGSDGGSGTGDGSSSSPGTTPTDPLPGTGSDPAPAPGDAANPAPVLPAPDSPFLPDPEPTPEPTPTPTPDPPAETTPPSDDTGSTGSDETLLPPEGSPAEGPGDCQLVICVGE